MKKILAFSASRSDYDLLSDLFVTLNQSESFEFKLIVSGAHMSATYGSSLEDIEKDGLQILAKSETLLDSDSKVARIKSASIMMLSVLEAAADYSPDLILYAGDREDQIMAALIGAYLEIPTAHFYGGDHVADSHVDNPLRHAISKLTTVHFVSCDEHKRRLLKLGEPEYRIYDVGSIALTKFNRPDILNFKHIRKELQLPDSWDKYAMVIFHPIPVEREKSAEILKNIIQGLFDNGYSVMISYPNIDPGNRSIIEFIETFKGDDRVYFYKNLKREHFLSVYKHCDFIIGNSSSGVLESASLGIPCVNVGYRQRGRLPNENVIFSGTEVSEIREAINEAVSDEFREHSRNVRNIYGDGNSVEKVIEIIKNNDFGNIIFKDDDPLEL